MPITLQALRDLVAMDPDDPVSRFSLGQRLFIEIETPEGLREATEHLRFANESDPGHLATYQVLGQVLIRQGKNSEARRILEEGCRRAVSELEGSGHDLLPILEDLLESI